MSLLKPLNPKPFLSSLIDKQVRVTLKWNGIQYVGKLVSFDNYMNLKMEDATEYMNEVKQSYIGEIFIRCNNVLHIGESKALTEKNVESEIVLENNETLEAVVQQEDDHKMEVEEEEQ